MYVEALKRKASAVKRPKDTAAAKAEKPAEAETAEAPEIAEEKPDQLVRSDPPAELPEITNDDVPAQPALLEGNDD